MKKIMQQSLRPLLAVLVMNFLFTACKKDTDSVQQGPVAGLMAFNLAVDKPAIGFTLSGNYLGNGTMGFTQYTGAYLPIYTGTRELQAIDVNTNATLATATANFADSNYYSAFLLGGNGSYRNMLLEDHLQSLTQASGKAWVRYINAITDSTVSPLVIIGANGESVINENAAYAHVSPFVQVGAGQVSTSVSNGTSISASRNISLEENKIYTVLFVGQPNPTDQALGVQVKFIQNGIITP